MGESTGGPFEADQIGLLFALRTRPEDLLTGTSWGMSVVATTPDARIELYRVPRYTVSGQRVVFEQGDHDDRSRLLVGRDGRVSFHPVLRAAGSRR